jgi:hypothetical protein
VSLHRLEEAQSGKAPFHMMTVIKLKSPAVSPEVSVPRESRFLFTEHSLKFLLYHNLYVWALPMLSMSVGSSSKPRLLLLPLSPKLKTTRKKNTNVGCVKEQQR